MNFIRKEIDVLFDDMQWLLTQQDGHLGVANVFIRKFKQVFSSVYFIYLFYFILFLSLHITIFVYTILNTIKSHGSNTSFYTLAVLYVCSSFGLVFPK